VLIGEQEEVDWVPNALSKIHIEGVHISWDCKVKRPYFVLQILGPEIILSVNIFTPPDSTPF
jgi:hypothetical protein